MDFKGRLLASRRISVWGLGYLGYTTLLRLQSKGFSADVTDKDSQRLEKLLNGSYPDREQKETWSSAGAIPLLDLERISLCHETTKMFRNNVHIISFPAENLKDNKNKLSELALIFQNHKNKLHDALIIFQSAETPGGIEEHFVNPLIAEGVDCSFASAFRSDWSLEEFLHGAVDKVVAGNDAHATEKVKHFYNLLGIKVSVLSGIKEAEIYENAKKTFSNTFSAFISQLSLSFPNTDIRAMTKLLSRKFSLAEDMPKVGSISYKTANAARHLQGGSRFPQRLTLLSDADQANLSSILLYAEIIKRKAADSVTILGLSESGNMKDIRFSPALILAEQLTSNGTKVYIHDPFFSAEEVQDLLPEAEHICTINHLTTNSCVILMSGHDHYKYISQEDLDRLGVSAAKIIIDNIGFWKEYAFSADSFYHTPGDGKLEELER